MAAIAGATAVAACVRHRVMAVDTRPRVTAVADVLLPVVGIRRRATAAADPRIAVDRRTAEVAADTADNSEIKKGKTGVFARLSSFSVPSIQACVWKIISNRV
jgi:hypothetical protein